jgi:sulfite exporter TauE/SafE
MRTVLGIGTSVTMLVLGVSILFGFIAAPQTPSNLRWMMGVVLILYAVYRAVVMYTERQHHQRQRENR